MMSEPNFIPFDEICVGDTAQYTAALTEGSVNEFSRLFGDADSFHVSDERAAITPFGKRIAHGIHIAGFLSVVMGQKLPGFGTVYLSQTLDFKGPVYLGETVVAAVTVLEKLPHHRLRLRTEVTKQAGQPVLDGIATVKTYR